MGSNLAMNEGTYFSTGMPSLSRWGANSYILGRYAPLKKYPKYNPINGTIA